ncbi:divalent-cation tolerance protein CutA [Meiothermus sp. QL-1]|uniref:divalent-cation tolerance protein CutA n=1 Tax=Meiothermus sp. QL-1 TaxID=2058095 RepID=UPI000E0B35DC|nr:divalent-cation tolerance protein CutA [Meiothermus sp. QL-1]RDI96436.1 divalent-cation tolerance protein CutA [Meiothermus sp. QL-1]
MNLVVLCTVPNAEIGLSIARTLVHEGLAACVNLLPGLTSVYRWEGRVEENPEHLLLIKTRQERYAELERRLQALHPYQVPEILALEVKAGLPAYLAWLEASTS